MQVLISGASGLIGSALRRALNARGDGVTRLVRRREDVAEDARYWNPGAGELAPGALDGIDAIIHLAGEPIADGRWTAAKKKRIERSRVAATELLARAIADAPAAARPATFISSSAVGIYGDRGDERLTESSSPGTGFLADVGRRWEQATEAAGAAGVRVVLARTGVVLSQDGGALPRMLPPFRMGLGGPLGSGRQYMSWITEADVTAAFLFLLDHSSIAGPVNLTSPNPVTNADFAHALGHVLNRPTVFKVPAVAARLALGELADEALLASQRVIPERLLEAGFTFRHPDVEAALRAVIEA